MRPRAVGGFEPDDREQAELVELWHLSRTALSGTGLDSRDDRIRWVCDAFLKEHKGEPNVAHKWIYVWAVDNVGMLIGNNFFRETNARKRSR